MEKLENSVTDVSDNLERFILTRVSIWKGLIKKERPNSKTRKKEKPWKREIKLNLNLGGLNNKKGFFSQKAPQRPGGEAPTSQKGP